MPAELAHRFGLELTFHCPERRRYNDLTPDRLHQLSKQLRTACRRRGLTGGDPRVKPDDATIEITSPVIRSLPQLRTFYGEARHLADQCGLRVNARGWCTGGGHLHVSWPRPRIEFVEYFCRESTNHPYVNWVFAEPEWDNDAVVSLIKNCDNLLIGTGTRVYWNTGKCNGINVRERSLLHIEFRFFQAPRDYHEQELHVLFADRWLSHVRRRYKAGEPVERRYRDAEALRRIPRAAAESGFYALVEEIGLDPDDYRIFVRRNLAKRYAWGFLV